MIAGNRRSRRAWAAEVAKHIKPGNVFQVQVRHDDECSIYGPLGECNCNPDRVILDDKQKVVSCIRGAGSYRIEEFAAASRLARAKDGEHA